MEQSIDTLRAEMWRDRYTAIFNQYRALAKREQIMREEYDVMAQDLDDFYQERCDLKETLLREKETSERYSHEAIELRLRCEKLQEKIDEYEEREVNLQEENTRLHRCLKDMVNAGTRYLAFSQLMAGVNGAREVPLRDAIKTGKEELGGE